MKQEAIVRTKMLMVSSAFVMFALGLILTFAPQETAGVISGSTRPLEVLLLQAGGALYLGFAILNWMAKDNLIGGIYSRPVAMGNFLHFFAMAMVLSKATMAGLRSPSVLLAAATYVSFAVWFGIVTFGSPKTDRSK